MIALRVFMALKLVTLCHTWSQVITLVTVEVKNLNKDNYDV